MTPGIRGFAPVHADQTLGEAFATILDHNFQAILEWQEIARMGEDIEGVHQVRVSFRRSRSALKVFRPAVPRKASDPWFVLMRDLVSETGPARDLDVFIHEGLHEMEAELPKTGAKTMLAAAWRAREKAYDRVRAMLDGEGYRTLRHYYPDWIAEAGWTTVKSRKKEVKRLNGPVIKGARHLLGRQYRMVTKAGTGIDQHDAPAMHKLRIACKGLRYTSEFFSPLFADMAEFVIHLKGLQDVLGVMNDGAVTRDLVDHIVEGRRDKRLLAYGEAVVQWRMRQMEEMRTRFDPQWTDFAATPCPWAE